jgi:hypothetical protein
MKSRRMRSLMHIKNAQKRGAPMKKNRHPDRPLQCEACAHVAATIAIFALTNHTTNPNFRR